MEVKRAQESLTLCLRGLKPNPYRWSFSYLVQYIDEFQPIGECAMTDAKRKKEFI